MMPSEILKGLSVTFRSMFRKRNTVRYRRRSGRPRPVPRPPVAPYPDGLERCIGCELCAYACPADAIYVQGADNFTGGPLLGRERYAAIYQINYNRCIFCGLCIEALPDPRPDHDQRVRAVLADPPGWSTTSPTCWPPCPPGPRPAARRRRGRPADDRPLRPQASLSRESVEPVWALLRAQEAARPTATRRTEESAGR